MKHCWMWSVEVFLKFDQLGHIPPWLTEGLPRLASSATSPSTTTATSETLETSVTPVTVSITVSVYVSARTSAPRPVPEIKQRHQFSPDV